MKNTNTKTGRTPDELRPEFIFRTINTKLLTDAINGKINLKELVKQELNNRGVDNNGNWVGFKS